MKLFSEIKWTLKNCIIFLDVDGTLVSEGGSELSKESLNTFAKLRKNNLIFLCSNSPKKDRTKKLAKQLQVDWTKGTFKKPDERLLHELKIPKDKRKVVIGNLHCIDGRFAKNIGAQFFPVKTLVGKNEPYLNKLFYFMDRILLSKCI